ncbi:MAG: DUF7336 domain-containing protein [Candidatus Nezhaarchaeales archaeon]
MSELYMVSQGEYSDYKICGVFDSKELAEKFIKSFGVHGYDAMFIEEIELNPHEKEVRNGFKSYFLYINILGDTRDIRLNASYPSFEGSGNHFTSRSNELMVDCFAKNEAHAAKIANERRVQIIAAYQWPNS